MINYLDILYVGEAEILRHIVGDLDHDVPVAAVWVQADSGACGQGQEEEQHQLLHPPPIRLHLL
jgi:hypothetical protein